MLYKNVVVKIGSSVLAPGAKLDDALLTGIVRQLCALIDANVNVTLVCSGAIACGIEALKLTYRPKETNKLQALAAIGQGKLMHAFEKASEACGKQCAQVLLIREDVDARDRYLNAKRTFEELHALRVLPVVNENDTTSTEEINFGDNDTLSAMVAGLLDADLLIVLSNVDGFLDNGAVVPQITAIDEELMAKVVKKESQFTKGGMESKLTAIGIALNAGVKVMLTNGRKDGVITKIVLEGNHIGTLFHPLERLTARKRWIAHAKVPRGSVAVDDGAVKALVDNGSSLLAQGIREVKGDFAEGDTVCVTDTQGRLIAWGMIGFDAAFLRAHPSQKLEKEVIHRDDMVVSK